MNIHKAHYDWWMFPLDERSSYELDYTVFADDIEDLKHDEEFMKNYKEGIKLLLLAWGWDIEKKELVMSPQNGQKWQQYPIRFYKAAKSALLFGENEYFESMRLFALQLGDANLQEENGYRVRKLFNMPGTENKAMPPPRYGQI